ncbi:MAG: hypothetical protein U0002_21845 [Thermoanaerobaculia bacterium]
MATANFSIPASLKAEFDRVFRGENKSAIVSRLMAEAVAERRRSEQRARAIEALLSLQGQGPERSQEEVDLARQSLRR